MNFEIYWDTSISTFFSYGSVVKYFTTDKKVIFNNILCSPGTVIVQWDSNEYYYSSNRLLQLPLLKRGYEYKLISDIKLEPEYSIFIKLSFYNRVGELVSTHVMNEQYDTFIYPLDGFSYKIELINMCVKNLKFSKLMIKSK